MASGIDKLAQQIAKLLKNDSPSGYDTTATVTRIEDGTAWVHIPGGVDETPVRMTVNANVGDNVQVRVSGGRAFIVGNGSAPPTDDTRANYAAFAAKRAQSAADKAEEDAIYAAARAAEANERAQAAQEVATATSQHFWTDDGGVHVSSEADNATATRNTLWNSLGMLFRKGANILLAITTGTTPSIDFYDGAGNAGSNILASFGSAGVRIGTANATQIVLDSTNGLRLGTKVSIAPSGNAKFDGEVQSTSGKIGGWDITASSLKGEHNNKGTGFQIPSSGTWAIAVGYDTTTPASGWSTAAFRVNHSGQVFLGDKLTLKGASKTYAAIDFIVTSNNTDVNYGGLSITNSDALSLRGTNGTAVSDPSSVDIHTGGNTYFSYINMGGDSSTDGVIMIQCRTRNATPLYGLVIDSSGTYKNTINGNLKVSSSIYGDSAIGTGGKTAWNDTNKGCWLTSNGNIHLMDSATSGGAIGFHHNFSASATTILHEATAGVLTNTGRLETKDWTGTRRTPVSSISVDGLRVGYMKGTSSTNLVVCAQWGTAGGAFSEKNVTVSSSDIRLKKNVEDCEIDSALDIINQIRLHSFDWLHTDEHQKIGFIADELEQIDPKLSIGGGTEKDGTINYKSIDTFYMMGYLVKAVQELSTEVERLRRELNGNHSES